MPEKHPVEGFGNQAKVSIYFHGALFLMIYCKSSYDNGQIEHHADQSNSIFMYVMFALP